MLRCSLLLAAAFLTACSGTAEIAGFPEDDEDMGLPPWIIRTDGGMSTAEDMGTQGSDMFMLVLPDAEIPESGVDTDGDGLDDLWEYAAGDRELLDWELADSDGDGTNDAAEDYDNDGLTNAEEFNASFWTTSPSGPGPHPLRADILVELDQMQGRAISDAALARVVAAFADFDHTNIDGTTGLGIQIYRDEVGIAPMDFDGSFQERHAFFASHGPTYANTPTALPVTKMVHVAIVTRRTDSEFRGGEVVTDGEGNIENTGLLIFRDALAALHPQCDIQGMNIPPLVLEDAMAGTFIHEMGHILQLGHDTDVGGGTNTFNVMAVPTTCAQARERFRGEGNADSTLGATEAVGDSRFSQQAMDLIQLNRMVSVHTSQLLDDGDGIEM